MPLLESGLLWPLVVVIFLLGLLVGIVVIFLLGKPNKSCRFSWQQLLTNNVFISYIDKDNKNWTVEIVYNNECKELVCKHVGDRSIKIKLPADYTKSNFIEMINQMPSDNKIGHVLLRGILDGKLLSKLDFTSKDMLMYRDFKNYLLVGILKS